MIVDTTQDILCREIIKILGLAQVNSVRARHAGRYSMASLRNLVGV